MFITFAFLLSSYTMSTTCDHFTASVKHVKVLCACVCMDEPTCLCFTCVYSLHCKDI